MEAFDLERWGVSTTDDIVLQESSTVLENDIRAVPGLSELLHDDWTAIIVGHHMINGVIRKFDKPVFLRICDGEIGQMLSNLRGKDEPYMFFQLMRPDDPRPLDATPERFLEAAGWEVLNDSDHMLFWKAWEEAGRKWIE